MPAYRTQGELGECRAFALTTIIQKMTCDEWPAEIPDCSNPPPRYSISPWGMMKYTNRNQKEDNTLQINQEEGRGIYATLEVLSVSNDQIIDSCRPFERIVASFTTIGLQGIAKRDSFFKGLEETYRQNRGVGSLSPLDQDQLIAKINDTLGLDLNSLRLRKAFNSKSYDHFLYTLFFDGCPERGFPTGFRIYDYPVDILDVTPIQIKNKVIQGLKTGNPVYFGSLCLTVNTDGTCDLAHALVISGYKQVVQGKAGSVKDVFKVHNSWGKAWQIANNDGWVDADILTENSARMVMNGKLRIGSSSVTWIIR